MGLGILRDTAQADTAKAFRIEEFHGDDHQQLVGVAFPFF